MAIFARVAMNPRNRNRKKLINAILFFALKTNKKKIGKLKMSKLLFALDFEHFKKTGRFVTGITYYAYPNGPYPKDEFEKVSDKEIPIDFAPSLAIVPMYEKDGEDVGYLFKPRTNVKPDLSIFSRRELEILRWLAEVFHDATGKEMRNWSHQHGTPWQRVWETERKRYQPIPYSYAIDDTSPLSKEEAEDILREEEEFDQAFPYRKA